MKEDDNVYYIKNSYNNMKEGDKVYCIRNSYNNKNELVHIKGKYYKICDYFRDITYLEVEPGSITTNKYGYFSHRFSHFFMTIKEQRKEKIEKINENQISSRLDK